MTNERVRVLAISGSLRAVSSNGSLLAAAARLAPADMDVALSFNIGELPHFNPDLDTDSPPEAVARFRTQLREADGVIFSTPEYVHSMPGALQDALNWIVSSAELFEKPVLLLNASPNAGKRGQDALIYMLGIMMANVVPEISLVEPFLHKRMDEDEILNDVESAGRLRASLAAFDSALRALRAEAQGA